MKILRALLLTLLLAPVLFAQALSKQDVIELKKAGVDDRVLIQQIQKDGISFELNAATTIELKGLGVSDDVLSALLSSGKTANRPAPATQNDSVGALYKAGRFPELADRLKTTLKANPSDYKTQALLILTLLKMKENDAAHAEYQQLAAHNQDPAAVRYVNQVKALIDSLQATEEAKTKLIAAVKDDRVADATAVVDQLPVSLMQKELLRINLDLYQGKFDQARDRFSKIPFSSYAEKERSGKILENISAAEATYTKLVSRIEFYLHSRMSPVECSFPISATTQGAAYAPQYTEDFKKIASMSSNEYVSLVSNLNQLVPLNDDAKNLSFHAELLTGNYGQLELLGDKLLKDKGRIRIPFFGRDKYFELVIDSERKHIYTEPDLHPFMATFPGKFTENYWAELVPFDLPFDQIKALDQHAGRFQYGGIAGSNAAMIARQSYALKFEPNGVAPNYALMNILYCTAGEKAELTVTRNLGEYILHVIGNNSIKTDLADPSKAKGAPNGLLTGLLTAGVSMSANPAVRDAGIQGLATDQAQQNANYQAQQVAFGSFANQETFNFVEADAYTGLEELLGVLN